METEKKNSPHGVHVHRVHRAECILQRRPRVAVVLGSRAAQSGTSVYLYSRTFTVVGVSGVLTRAFQGDFFGIQNKKRFIIILFTVERRDRARRHDRSKNGVQKAHVVQIR